MNYITVVQLSERWETTPRYIQNLCRNGRIPGALRFGKSWMIPEDAVRPADLRQKNADKTNACNAFVPHNEVCASVPGAYYRAPGTAEKTIKSLVDNPEAQTLAKAQFAYLKGEIDIAKSLVDKLFYTSADFEIKMGSAFVIGICAMYNGDVAGFRNAKKLIEELPCQDDSQKACRELWIAAFGASVYDISAFPEWLCRGCFDLLPAGYHSSARVYYAKYIYICGDAMLKKQIFDSKSFDGQLFLLPAICEPLISQTILDKAIISEIYLRLICASSYHHAGDDIRAVKHIDRALALALPDAIFAPFAEQRTNLDALIDERVKAISPNSLEKIRLLNAGLKKGWTVIHNTLLKGSYSNKLTVKELEAARLAAFGLTNNEIADRMGISINSVKAYLQAAKDKTGARKRIELAKFV